MTMKKILDKVNSPEDIKELNIDELKALSNEIRNFLIESVSETGGHFASNLGVTELTLALHYVFNSPVDKIVWDVGHQSYIHKIITGRKDKMGTLRQFGGISGYPKREESEHDTFNTGHSSTSISAAIGMARGRDIRNEKHEVIAVIGDGALTGGMAFEALNDAGRSNTKLMVVLNDNEMSISHNVGGLSQYLSKIRTEPAYYSTKKDIEKIVNKIPILGGKLKKILHKTKEGIKQMIVPGMLFEEIGLKYLGPIDGHDIEDIIDVLKRAKNEEGPVLVHICTQKGKGYKLAEEKPDAFHGISAFDPKTGKKKDSNKKTSYSKVFGGKLCNLATNNKNLAVITAAMIDGTGLTDFAQKYPERLFDVGIAEQHAVTMAAGLAVKGIVPVVAIYSSFLQRAYDQLIHDVAMQNLHIVFAIDRAGLVGRDGETHQGIFDTAFLSHIPNMTIMAPADYIELESMLEYAINKHKGPIAIRYPRGDCEKNLVTSSLEIKNGKGMLVKEGKDISIIANGRMVHTALKVAEILKDQNISAEIINLRFIKPLDKELILSSCNKTKTAVIIDETIKDGSISNKIQTLIPNDVKIIIETLPNKFILHGSVEELLKANFLDEKSIADNIIKNIKK